MKRTASGAAGLALVALVACRKTTPAATADAASAGNDLSQTPIARRCTPEGTSSPLPGGESTIVGDGMVFGEEWVVGAVRQDKNGLRGKALRASRDLTRLTEIDVCSPDGDAPPPRIWKNGSGMMAGCYARSPGEKKKGRVLSLYDLTEKATFVASLPQGVNDSFGFDVATNDKGSFVVWVEDDAKSEKPLVRMARISIDGKLDPTKTLTTPEVDVDSVRIVATEAGFVVAWIALQREGFPSLDASIEGAGESRYTSWVEWLALDATGAPAGVPMIATKRSHVSWFTLARRAATTELLFVDDQAKAEGGGGRLLRVALGAPPNGAAAGESEVLSTGVGSAFPDFFVGDGKGRAWLAFTDVAERTKALPFDWAGKGGAPLGEPSDEIAFARPLAARGDSLLGLVFGDPAPGGPPIAPPRLRVSTCIP